MGRNDIVENLLRMLLEKAQKNRKYATLEVGEIAEEISINIKRTCKSD